MGGRCGQRHQTCVKQRIDMIVMGSRGLSALSGLFMGSVTIKVIAVSQIPVTVIR